MEIDQDTAARLRRAERWALLDRARPLSVLPRVQKCRKVTLTGTGGPTLRVHGTRGAGYAGLATCGSVWACPCCAGKIAARRADELARVMAVVYALGGSAHLVTLTMRHHTGHRLSDLWDACAAAWARVTSGEQWMTDSAGLLGWARVVEVTHGAKGWHVHVHALLCWSGKVDEADAQGIAMRAWLRWDRALRRRGLDSTPVHGVDARPVVVGSEGLGEYFVKAAREVTTGHTKDARGGSRTPFAILRDAVETYRVDDIELWRTWERGSHGRKQLTWSTGRRDLRRLAGLGREATDDEIAAEEAGGTDLIALPGDTWDALQRTGSAPILLDVAEVSGMPGATALLDRWGLLWQPATAPPRRDRRTDLTPQTRRQARAVLRPPKITSSEPTAADT